MRFLLAVIDDKSNSATSNEIAAIDEFNDYLRAEGLLIMACGLEKPDRSTVLDNRLNAGFRESGPLHELPEFMSGFWIISADSEEQAERLAACGSKACNRKIELRPLHG